MVQHPKSGTEHEKNGNGVPETTNVKEGSASRNIKRKGDLTKGYVRVCRLQMLKRQYISFTRG